MTIISKGGIGFIEPRQLVGIGKTIEKRLPGWWWSLSQGRNLVTFSSGPGRNGPNLQDFLLANTKGGDEGFIYTVSPAISFPEYLDMWIDKTIDFNSWNRWRPDIAHLGPVTLKGDKYRFQSDEDWDCLKEVYARFLDNVDGYESKSLVIRELYLGSCDLTVDCSIRGIDTSNDSQFDFSNDLDDGIIADSLEMTMEDIGNYVQGIVPG